MVRRDADLVRWGPVPLRLVVGLVFILHGAQKLLDPGPAGTAGFLGQLGVPLPAVAAAVLIAIELVGGLLVLIGWCTRWAAALLALDMLGAMLLVHLRNGFFLPDGVEFVLTLFAGCATLILLGPGGVSVDERLEGRPAP
jgi:putative oxidoreductase